MPTIDSLIGKTGIPLPNINLVNLTNSVVTTEDGYLDIEATPVFNFTDAMYNPMDYGSRNDSEI